MKAEGRRSRSRPDISAGRCNRPPRVRFVAAPLTAASTSIGSARKWGLVCLLGVGMMIAYIDRANLSVALAVPAFRDFFGLDDTDRGFLNSAFFWSYAALQIPAGWIVDRYGAKLPYALGFVFWSLVSAATGLAQNNWQLASARLWLGAGEAVSTPASLRWIRCNCREEERGLATGIYFSGTKIGTAIGFPLTAVLVARFGWRWMFAILGLGGLAWVIAWMAFANRDGGVREKRAPAVEPASSGLAAMLKTRTSWGILLGTFAYNYFIYFCLTWLPAYLVEYRRLSMHAMSVFSVFSFTGMAVVATAAGWFADRSIRRGGKPVRVRKLFTILGFVLASTEILGALSHSQFVALFFAVFSMAGLGLATANYWALTQTIVPARTIGRYVGVQNMASNCSGVAAPILTGWLNKATGDYRAAMVAVLAMMLLGIYSYAFLVRPMEGENSEWRNL